MMGRKIMGETGIKPIVIEEICDLAKKYNVKKVILFGSRARGSFKEKSDIDLDEEIQSELRDSIKKEGKTIYEEI